MKPILILLMLSSFMWAADAPAQNDKLPNDVVALLNAYDKDVAKIQNDAAVATQLRTDKLKPLLIKAQEAATKKGSLDVALAIKSEVEKLDKGDEKVAKNDAHSSRDVILYVQPDFKGPGTIVKDLDNVIEVYKIHFPNDGLRSIKVPSGFEVIAYSGDLGGGDAYSITGDMADLTGTTALGMTSFIIKRVK